VTRFFLGKGQCLSKEMLEMDIKKKIIQLWIGEIA
jgi:hypothetical protein